MNARTSAQGAGQPPVRGRYAPSPSGYLHLGNARTALLAWWHARQARGSFVLRMDDLDPDRSKPDVAAGILSDLRWLGIDWDEGPDVGGPSGPYNQSQRGSLYRQALERLREARRIYPCWCTRAEVRRAATAPHGRPGSAHVYPGTCRPRDHEAWRRADQPLDATGLRDRAPAWRFAVEPGLTVVPDLLAGNTAVDVAHEVGDFIVRRSDGVAAYHLATAVDDAVQGITHVVRGADLLETTPCQMLVREALGLGQPAYAHVPLVVDESGRRLAKRDGDLTLAALRASGVKPERIVGLLAYTCGLIARPVPVAARELTDDFSLDKIHKAPATLDEPLLAWLTGGGN